MQEIIVLVSRKTLHWFRYVANFCWIVREIILSATSLDIDNRESRFDFRCGSNGDKVENVINSAFAISYHYYTKKRCQICIVFL